MAELLDPARLGGRSTGSWTVWIPGRRKTVPLPISLRKTLWPVRHLPATRISANRIPSMPMRKLGANLCEHDAIATMPRDSAGPVTRHGMTCQRTCKGTQRPGDRGGAGRCSTTRLHTTRSTPTCSEATNASTGGTPNMLEALQHIRAACPECEASSSWSTLRCTAADASGSSPQPINGVPPLLTDHRYELTGGRTTAGPAVNLFGGSGHY